MAAASVADAAIPPFKKARLEISYPTQAFLWSIRKFGSARKIGYSEPERCRRLQKNRF
jgi:hypothetical protein